MDLRVVGVLSGTSHDAVDCALIDLSLDGDTLIAAPRGSLSVAFPDDLHDDLLACLPPHSTSAEALCKLHWALGQLFAEAATRAVRELGDGRADLVVSHGQTVFHWVEGRTARGGLQLGAPAVIAERTGLPVVSDLRSSDIARGGHGAPLVSMLDALLLLTDTVPRGALNLGGIANLTVRRDDGELLAYDLGPAGAVLDAAMRHLTGGRERMDTDGRRAAVGAIRPDLLQLLLDEPYYRLEPPKSTGKERFHAGYLREVLNRMSPVEGDDLLATLVELTATLVASACRQYGLAELVVAGGGVRNLSLMRRIADLAAPTRIREMDEFGLPAQAKEAYLFALLGYLTVHGLPGTIPSATGAGSASILGSLTPGAGPLRLPPPGSAAPVRMRIASPAPAGREDSLAGQES